jgi:hypothetical protein
MFCVKSVQLCLGSWGLHVLPRLEVRVVSTQLCCVVDYFVDVNCCFIFVLLECIEVQKVHMNYCLILLRAIGGTNLETQLEHPHPACISR